MVADTQLNMLPQMRVFRRVKSLPIVKGGLDVAANGYSKIKGYMVVNSIVFAAQQSIHYIASLLSILTGGKFEKFEKLSK